MDNGSEAELVRRMLGGDEGAFDEFFADKPEGIIELPTTQCMVVKL